jgi:hypothetical protein
MKSIARPILLATTFLAPVLVSAQVSIGISIGSGGASSGIGGVEGKVEKGHQLMLWGIIGFVVMISLWGLVNVVSSTFNLAGIGAPPLPQSY